MSAIQQLYICVLNRLFKLSEKVNDKNRNIIIGACFFLIATVCFFYTTWEKYGIQFGYAELLIINTVLFCIVIVFSVKKPLKKVRWNKAICIPWFICCILMIFAGIHHSITDALLFSAGIMLVVFPCFYFVWNNRGDYDTLYRISSKSIVTSIMLFYLVNMLCEPLVDGQAYYGIAVNSNSIGIASVAGVIVSLYLVYVEKRRRWIYVIAVGISVAFACFSVSRASLVAIILVGMVYVIVVIRGVALDNKQDCKISVIITMAIMISIILSVTVCKFILEDITPKTQSYIEQHILLTSYAEEQVEEPETGNSNVVIEKFSKGDDLNSFSSGRVAIWKTYIKELDFIGHERNEKGLYIEEMYGQYSAHNSYIEIAYRCGILAGVFYAWIAIYAAVYAFRFMFGKKLFVSKYILVPMAVVAFGVLSNLERALYPFEKVHILLFFIALAPMFSAAMMKNNENEE